MKQKWNNEQLEICYSNTVPKFEDGYSHAEKQGIPRFIEEYRIARVKDAIAPWIIDKTAKIPNPKVLDIGCGHGWYPFHLIDKWSFNGHITGIDISEHNIKIFQDEITKRKYSGKLSANIANAEALPYPDNTFDTVYSTEALEHIESPENFFKEATRVLKPGGRLIITTPSGPIHKFWKIIFWMPSRIRRIFHKKKRGNSYQIFEKSLSWKQIKLAYNHDLLKLEHYHKSIILPHESYIQFFPTFMQHVMLIKAKISEHFGPLTRWIGLHHIICLKKI